MIHLDKEEQRIEDEADQMVPVSGEERTEKILLKGEIPSSLSPPVGCRFHPRCPEAMPVCSKNAPARKQINGREVLCHLY